MNYFSKLEDENNLEKGSIKIQAAIETPKGVLNALEIAQASKRVVAISLERKILCKNFRG